MTTARTLAALLLAAASLAPFTGCDSRSSTKPAAPKPASAAVTLPVGLFLTAEPKDARIVEDAKKDGAAGKDVVMRGRIGGSVSPFVDNRAIFTIVGPSLKACADTPGDECKTPWDYCCEQSQDIAAHMATVQITGPDGAPLKTTLKGQSGLKELTDVIVVGKIAQAEGPVLVVNATGIYVAKPITP